METRLLLIGAVDIPPPWLARVTAIKEAAAFNADTERKVLRLSEELKDVLREVKIRVSAAFGPTSWWGMLTLQKDQSLQEAGVKVETLERRLETTRKQADTIMELENDVAKVKKQEKVYTEAIEQMQAEQDALEAENAKLRKGHGVDHQGEPCLGNYGQGAKCKQPMPRPRRRLLQNRSHLGLGVWNRPTW